MNQCWLIGLLMVSAILATGSINNCHRLHVTVFSIKMPFLMYSQLFSVFMFVHGRLYYYVIFRMFWCEGKVRLKCVFIYNNNDIV